MNNCQTIVSEIISILSQHLRRVIEPVIDLGSNFMKKEEFLKFGSLFNYRFSAIGPFSLLHRLSYFDTFSDKDSCKLLYPKNFVNIKKKRMEYLEQENVRRFLTQLEDALAIAPKIHLRGSIIDLDEEERLPQIDFEEGEKYSVVSYLIHLIYNELFDIRREIKIARQCEEDLAELEDEECMNKDDKKVKKREIEEWKVIVGRLPELYREKYESLKLYKELCFYYYNTMRLRIKIKMNDSVSCLGFLLTRKPDYDSVDLRDEGRESERTKVKTEITTDIEI